MSTCLYFVAWIGLGWGTQLYKNQRFKSPNPPSQGDLTMSTWGKHEKCPLTVSLKFHSKGRHISTRKPTRKFALLHRFLTHDIGEQLLYSQLVEQKQQPSGVWVCVDLVALFAAGFKRNPEKQPPSILFGGGTRYYPKICGPQISACLRARASRAGPVLPAAPKSGRSP